MNAYKDLIRYLSDGKKIEAIIFGPWGRDGYKEPDPNPVPHELFGKVLTEIQAEPLMHGWSFNNGCGKPLCYSVRVFTNKRIIWATQYDESTQLDDSPRNPLEGYIPDIPGGW